MSAEELNFNGFLKKMRMFFNSHRVIDRVKQVIHKLSACLPAYLSSDPAAVKEYYLKLDGYFYSKRQRCTIAVIRVRNKRATDLIAVNKIITDKNYLRELHPVDACLIGIIANNERNGIVNKDRCSLQKMYRFRDFACFIKFDSLLTISKIYTRTFGNFRNNLIQFRDLIRSFGRNQFQFRILSLLNNSDPAI